MTPAETAELLGYCAAFDSRKVSRVDVSAWHAALSDLGAEDAKAAVVAHYRENTTWAMPAHIRDWVKKRRAERVFRGPNMTELMDDVDPEDPNWRAIYAARIQEIANGKPTLRAVTA